MISEREEYEFKDGGTLVLSNGEDGVTVEINLGKPMMGTYNDTFNGMKKLANDIGKYIMENRPEVFMVDGWDSEVLEQDRELEKIAIRMRRINPKYTRISYYSWMYGED